MESKFLPSPSCRTYHVRHRRHRHLQSLGGLRAVRYVDMRSAAHSPIAGLPEQYDEVMPGFQGRPSKPNSMWWSPSNVDAFKKMARLHNLVPSSLLVLVGAWAGTDHSASILLCTRVWLMAAVSSGVSAASMVVNDYFDYLSGADTVNAPHKPLPAGRILPDIAVMFGALVYMFVLIMACVMEPAPLRVLIASSAATTMAYTPLLKKWTIIKNVVVAAVIASALVAGALAAGVVGADLRPLLPASAFAFCGVMYREILMDINDVEGDNAAGICTLPVAVGHGQALLAAVCIACCGACIAIWALLSSPAMATTNAVNGFSLLAKGSWADATMFLRLVGGAMIAFAAFVQLATMAWSIAQSEFDRASVEQAVNGCMATIGLTVIALAAVVV